LGHYHDIFMSNPEATTESRGLIPDSYGIAARARGAARHGATPDDFAELLSVTILMSGGPGTVYAPKAWEAFKEFRERYS
jgi:alkylhydroperoxidase/carboxymuconolactone decarboxylase family protein YurZ